MINSIQAEIQIELEDMDEEDWDRFHDGAFDRYRDPKESESDSHSSEDKNSDDDLDIYSDDDGAFTPVSMDVKKLIQKLDVLLDILFRHARAKLDKGDKSLFECFLMAFNSLILPTHRLRCTQFLIFYTSSLDSAFPDDFMGLLASRIFDSGQPTGIRISAAAYLASFIARARFVDSSAVRTCLRLLVQYAVSYLDDHDSHVTPQNIGKHGVFYAVTQAVLYIACFRWSCITDSDTPQGQLPPSLTGIQRLLTSKLSPFKVCASHIVDEFARITHSAGVLYCYPFMSKDGNSKWRHIDDSKAVSILASIKTPEGSQSNVKTAQVPATGNLSLLILDRLDTCFPFDPLTLPTSKKYVADLYQEWDAGDSDSDDDAGLDAIDYNLSGTSIED